MTSAPATAPKQATTTTTIQGPANGNGRALTPQQALARELNDVRPHFKAILPSHIDPDQFNRVIVTAANLTPELATADRRSLLNACSKCASDGLLPDGREAALVMFGNKVQYLPMVAGVIKRLRQSGEVSAVAARVVYQAEIDEGLFRYVIEDGVEKLSHAPKLFGDRGAPALAYATARMKDGTIQNEVMTVADIEKVRKSSRSGTSGPWVQWWDEMARKTVVRRLSKYLPYSAEDRRIFEQDHETTEFEEAKALALKAQPQSITHAAMSLSAPTNPEETAHNAETGEILDAKPDNTEGEAERAEPNTISILEIPTREGGGNDYAAWNQAAHDLIRAATDPAWITGWMRAHAEQIKAIGAAKKTWVSELERAADIRINELTAKEA
jgi:recombination protein RecT